MSQVHQVSSQIYKKRDGKRVVFAEGEQPAKREPVGRIPRITRFMALAIYYEDLIRQGHVRDYAEIATLGHVTRARVTQIMNLRLLAPDIQDNLLNLQRIVAGRDSIGLREMQAVALEPNWRIQQENWNRLRI